MINVDLFSDTVYRDQASKQLDALIDEIRVVPVKRAQIYGLRQIARQQPTRVDEFAQHQRGRAERKKDNASENARTQLESEIQFWSLVERLCDSTTGWSVRREIEKCLPLELRDERIPAKRPGMTHEDRRVRNRLKRSQRDWLDGQKAPHIRAFFERFCTHALYRIEVSVHSEERKT